ncbi:MAG: hypothetical protein CL570_08320 [Alphaproteobacteria bacterium]|nr:hypothetical protein [Alphaproteobacteria bacterium]|tara:strand:+ start:44695 stop:45954 length:1260 start_codon:yes stop_codon:yes gene_type:complete
MTKIKVRDLLYMAMGCLVLTGTIANLLLMFTVWEQYQIDHAQDAFFKLAGSIGLAVISSCVVVAAVIIVTKNLTQPIKRLTSAMVELSNHDLDIHIPYQTHQNEFGDMARTLDMFRGKLIENKALNDQQLQDDQIKLAKAEAMETAITDFDQRVSTFMHDMQGSMTDLSDTSGGLGNVAKSGLDYAQTLQSAAQDMASNTELVSQSAQDMLQSIATVSERIRQSETISKQATGKVRDASASITQLQGAADEITGVITLINKIAHETNMLALNATIEAARAGEAGKSFSVVAGEVKKLANQTADATEDISAQVESVKSSVASTVAVIEDIEAVITNMEDVLHAVSDAMAQQNEASQNIASNARHAVSVSNNLKGTSEHIYSSAQRTDTASEDLGQVSHNLLEKTRSLKDEVQAFFDSIKH